MIVLTFCNLRRLWRHRALLLAMHTLPLVAGITRAILPDSPYSLGLLWACPLACALMAGVAILLQHVVDETTGFRDAVGNSPAGGRGLPASRFFAAVLLLISPSALLGLLLAAT